MPLCIAAPLCIVCFIYILLHGNCKRLAAIHFAFARFQIHRHAHALKNLRGSRLFFSLAVPALCSMAMLLKHARAMVTYLLQLGEKQPSSSLFDKALRAQCDHICTLLASEPMDFSLSAELSEVLEQAPFTGEQKQKLEEHLVNCMPAGIAGIAAKGKTKMQNFEAVSSYYTAEQWTCLESGNLSEAYKTHILLDQAGRLGCKHASEPTFKTLTAMILLCTQSYEHICVMTFEDKVRKLRSVKAVYKRKVKTLAKGVVAVLPDDPKELRESELVLYNLVYADGAPVEHPFGDKLAATVSMLRARASPMMLLAHGKSSEVATLPKSMANFDVSMLGSVLAMALQQQQHQQQQPRHAETDADAEVLPNGAKISFGGVAQKAKTVTMVAKPADAAGVLGAIQVAKPADAAGVLGAIQEAMKKSKLSLSDEDEEEEEEEEEESDGEKPKKKAKTTVLKKPSKHITAGKKATMAAKSPKTPTKKTTLLKSPKMSEKKTTMAAKSPAGFAKGSTPFKTTWSNEASRKNVQARAFYAGCKGCVVNKGFRYAAGAAFKNFKEARDAAEKWIASLG
jgi:hypothetical protein